MLLSNHLRYACLLLALPWLQSCMATRAADAVERGALLSMQPVSRFERQDIDANNESPDLSGPAQCDVRVVQLTYQSIGVKHEPATLSAGLYVPENCPGPFPILAEAHGTQTDRRRLTAGITAGEGSIAFFAAQGYVVVATDYLGLGKSTYPFHPYLHADSEASAVIDAIRAARVAAGNLDLQLSGQLMLFGYSQGGHATLAAQREMEREHREEFPLAASAPMSGPYHLSQTFLGSWFGQTAGADNTFVAELLAYAVVSYRGIYPEVCPGLDDCFAPPYAGIVTALFPSDRHLSEIRQQNLLPPGGQLHELRTAEFTAEFVLDERHSFRQALRRNDVLDWRPLAPTLLCGSRRDAIVDFNNARAAQASFRFHGVEVAVIDVADRVPAAATGSQHHGYAVPLCYAAAKTQLFDPIKQRALDGRYPLSRGTPSGSRPPANPAGS